MARVKGLNTVDSATGECAKLGCVTGSRTLHRHHRKHEAMWIGVWIRTRMGEKKFEDFCKNYHLFRHEDWTRLCDMHHAEIHLIYDEIIRKDKLKTGRPLYKYSWVQAEKLMVKLEAACLSWLKKRTPGLSPDSLHKLRERKQTLAERNRRGRVRAKDRSA